ncbi:MAG: helix-turn-helix domain-containing protein [Ectothiorhodospiraceae bacterium]|nr:helix-turn-helix domain-containing protein [Ectothiorhodospiraceae bacterium]MCH8502900.1 helix-turn-helix domain-containing protein [Ectothiorhodospiraceae bacterium]
MANQEIDNVLEFIRVEVQDCLRTRGVSNQVAEDSARAVTERVMLRYGGTPQYVSKTRRQERREAALRDFSGDNHDAVCRRHGISRRTLYRWLAEGQCQK